MRFLIPSSLALAVALAPAAFAQEVVQPLPGTTDADRLADTMRRLAVSPNDVSALLDAGELSLKVDDLSGAASLFARADKVDPRSARAKAGMAAILVRAERPGEALRYYAEAEALGIAPERIAADRGLAFDLIGQSERAQRDYRLALKNGAGDETVRRYALSLGISGKREEALAVLEPLVRRQDRGAWRARAFVLAMTGDVAGASTIATTMMPSGMAQGLLPFFQRLPALGAVDRAFAVHFGEVRATPERLADARLSPAFAPVPAETQPRPAVLAAVQPAPAEARGRGRDRRAEPRPTAAPPVAARAPEAASRRVERPADAVAVSLLQRQPLTPADVRVASAGVTRPVAPVVERAAATPAAASPIPAEAAGTLVVPTASAPATAPTVQPLPARVETPAPATVQPLPARVETAARLPSSATVQPLPSRVEPVERSPAIRPVPARAPTPVAPRPAVAVAARAPVPATPPKTRPAQDSVLARIIANLAVPGAEADTDKPARVPSAGLAEARAKAARDSAERRDAVARIAVPAEPARKTSRRGTELAEADTAEPAPARAASRRGRGEPAEAEAADPVPTRAAGRRGRAQNDADAAVPLTPAQKRAAERKETAERKLLADRKAAADRKAEAAAQKKAARAEPERIWVQVATGAYEGDLPKAWASVKGKAPDAFKGRAGYATPLRATNRVVTGPFKTQGEAQAFVNGLAKKGVSASTFTSDAGQKIAKLPAGQ